MWCLTFDAVYILPAECPEADLSHRAIFVLFSPFSVVHLFLCHNTIKTHFENYLKYHLEVCSLSDLLFKYVCKLSLVTAKMFKFGGFYLSFTGYKMPVLSYW